MSYVIVLCVAQYCLQMTPLCVFNQLLKFSCRKLAWTQRHLQLNMIYALLISLILQYQTPILSVWLVNNLHYTYHKNCYKVRLWKQTISIPNSAEVLFLEHLTFSHFYQFNLADFYFQAVPSTQPHTSFLFDDDSLPDVPYLPTQVSIRNLLYTMKSLMFINIVCNINVLWTWFFYVCFLLSIVLILFISVLSEITLWLWTNNTVYIDWFCFFTL